MVIVAEADCEASICAEAFTVMVAGDGMAGGAVYKPLVLILPQADPMQPDPLTLQLTAVFELPVTIASNCC